MKTIVIGDQKLQIKDYYCAQKDEYIARTDGKLWLYVNLTDVCNGTCPFCINPLVKEGKDIIDPASYREMLQRINNHIYGVSLTGGEPLLYPELANEIIEITQEVCGSRVEKDLVTNGTDFSLAIDILKMDLLDSVHLSRHRITDKENDQIFGFHTASAHEISSVLTEMENPAQVVLNCVLMAGGVDSVRNMAEYLEFASDLGIRNVCFIGMSRHNSFCESHYIDPWNLNLSQNARFHIWNEYHDHDYCGCRSGSYDAVNGSIRFYYRRIGDRKPSYARQLVYSADNRLFAGFSGKEISFGKD